MVSLHFAFGFCLVTLVFSIQCVADCGHGAEILQMLEHAAVCRLDVLTPRIKHKATKQWTHCPIPWHPCLSKTAPSASWCQHEPTRLWFITKCKRVMRYFPWIPWSHSANPTFVSCISSFSGSFASSWPLYNITPRMQWLRQTCQQNHASDEKQPQKAHGTWNDLLIAGSSSTGSSATQSSSSSPSSPSSQPALASLPSSSSNAAETSASSSAPILASSVSLPSFKLANMSTFHLKTFNKKSETIDLKGHVFKFLLVCAEFSGSSLSFSTLLVFLRVGCKSSNFPILRGCLVFACRRGLLQGHS